MADWVFLRPPVCPSVWVSWVSSLGELLLQQAGDLWAGVPVCLCVPACTECWVLRAPSCELRAVARWVLVIWGPENKTGALD